VLKVSEVYEKQIRTHKERADGTEYVSFQKVYDTRECLLNTRYVVSVQPYEFTASSSEPKLHGRFPEGTKFSSFVLDGHSFRSSEMIVVGSFDKFCSLLKKNQK
jgi:hypothetical protein